MKPIQHLPDSIYQGFCTFLESTSLTTDAFHRCKLCHDSNGWETEACTKADYKVCPMNPRKE